MMLKKFAASILMLGLALAAPAGWASDSAAEGAPAPDFRLQDQNGKWHTLADYKGQWLVLYFYPKDDTPGCTTEACNFRDEIFTFRKMGATILGVSTDDVASHKEFAEKYSLPFSLLADTDGKVSGQYAGFKLLDFLKIANRKSFLIDPEGRIARRYDKVDPDKHSAQVIEDLTKLM